jgi:hypothetical protein
MNTIEPTFCETCSDPLRPDEHIVQIREKVNASSQQASGVMGMFAKTHVYHPEHVPATGDYEVTYRGPLRGLPADATG